MASALAWHDAARRGDVAALRRLLRADASLACSRDAAGRTALHHLAALPPCAAAAEACAAVCAGAGAAATALLEAANDNGHTCLHRAALSGSRDVALALLAAGADPNARTAKERRSPLEVCRDSQLRAELEAAAAHKARSAAVKTPLAAALHASGGGAAPVLATTLQPVPHAAPAEAEPAASHAAADAQSAARTLPLPIPEEAAYAEAWETRDGPLSADEAAAAWDRAAAPLSAGGGFDRALAARLIARGVPPPPPLRCALWGDAAGVAPLRAALLRCGLRFEALSAGGGVAAALAALRGGCEDSSGVDAGVAALCLDVAAADAETAFWLALALRARLAPQDACAVALHAARRRPDLCCALGARGRGHTADYLLYTGVWRSAPAAAALEAPLTRWLRGGFAAPPDALPSAQLLRAWDAALLGGTAPAEAMARLAAARLAARADAVVAAAGSAPAEVDARAVAVAALLQAERGGEDVFDALFADARSMEWCEPPPPPPQGAPALQRPAQATATAAAEAEAEAAAALALGSVPVSAALAALRAEAAAAGAPEVPPPCVALAPLLFEQLKLR